MIDPKSYTNEWIYVHKQEKKFSKINPPLLEKMIRALGLLEALEINDLQFTFKGGTSLILLLPEPRRLSIDIDILTEHTRAELEVTFIEIIKSGLFKSWKLDERRSYKSGIPKAHYLFYFDSQIKQQEDYILLDVLFEKHKYPVIKAIPVSSSWIILNGEPIIVDVPSMESILGDKLTAFAPNTTGVPYGKEKSLDIVKQLHDVGQLFDHIEEMSILSDSFNGIVTQELIYRNLNINPDQVLDDIIDTALMIGKTERHHIGDEKMKYAEIRTGLNRFSYYLMTGNYYLETAIENAAKAAYIAAKLKVKDFTNLKRVNYEQTSFQFETMPYNSLNRLRNIKNASLFYWSKAAELLGIK